MPNSLVPPTNQLPSRSRGAKLSPTARRFELELLRQGAKPKGCIYVSTPITTGPLSLDPEYAGMPKATLRELNEKHASEVVRFVKVATGAVVIDPTKLADIDGWTQMDYHSFWIEIIDHYAQNMVFCNGWQFSTGCSIEYARGLFLDLPRFDEDLNPLPNGRALELLDAAISRMEGLFNVSAQQAARKLLVAR